MQNQFPHNPDWQGGTNPSSQPSSSTWGTAQTMNYYSYPPQPQQPQQQPQQPPPQQPSYSANISYSQSAVQAPQEGAYSFSSSIESDWAAKARAWAETKAKQEAEAAKLNQGYSDGPQPPPPPHPPPLHHPPLPSFPSTLDGTTILQNSSNISSNKIEGHTLNPSEHIQQYTATTGISANGGAAPILNSSFPPGPPVHPATVSVSSISLPHPVSVPSTPALYNYSLPSNYSQSNPIYPPPPIHSTHPSNVYGPNFHPPAAFPQQVNPTIAPQPGPNLPSWQPMNVISTVPNQVLVNQARPGLGISNFVAMDQINPNLNPGLQTMTYPIGFPEPSPLTTVPYPTESLEASQAKPAAKGLPSWLKDGIKKIASSNPSLDSQNSFNAEKQINEKETHSDLNNSDSEKEDERSDQDDEDRELALNNQIKSIMTEILLKVTDDLLEEIYQEVFDEEDEAHERIDRSKKEGIKKNEIDDESQENFGQTKAPTTRVLINDPLMLQTVISDSVMQDVDEKHKLKNILGLVSYDAEDEDEDEDENEDEEKEVIDERNIDNNNQQIFEGDKGGEVVTEGEEGASKFSDGRAVNETEKGKEMSNAISDEVEEMKNVIGPNPEDPSDSLNVNERKKIESGEEKTEPGFLKREVGQKFKEDRFNEKVEFHDKSEDRKIEELRGLRKSERERKEKIKEREKERGRERRRESSFKEERRKSERHRSRDKDRERGRRKGRERSRSRDRRNKSRKRNSSSSSDSIQRDGRRQNRERSSSRSSSPIPSRRSRSPYSKKHSRPNTHSLSPHSRTRSKREYRSSKKTRSRSRSSSMSQSPSRSLSYSRSRSRSISPPAHRHRK